MTFKSFIEDHMTTVKDMVTNGEFSKKELELLEIVGVVEGGK